MSARERGILFEPVLTEHSGPPLPDLTTTVRRTNTHSEEEAERNRTPTWSPSSERVERLLCLPATSSAGSRR